MARSLSQAIKAEKKLVLEGKIDESVFGRVQKQEELRSGSDYARALFAKSFVELYGLPTSSSYDTIFFATQLYL